MHAAATSIAESPGVSKVARRRIAPVQRVLAALLLVIASLPAAFGAQIRDSFDHLTTGFELVGQHRDLPCESCHANAVFKGTPRDCSACHGVGTAIRATAKNGSHILSTNRCDSCHTPVAWKPAVNFDHAEARGSCSTCHNNVQAQGKGPQHIDTNLECDVCHSTISWSGAFFTHAGITSGCASCHNGVQATGMPATHIPVNGAPCEACHSTTNFATFAGTAMNHAAVASIPCATCHEAGKSFFGVTIVTRPGSPHPATGDCGVCHGSTSSFKTDSLRPANHIPTNAPCAQCHTTANSYALYSVTGTHLGVTDCLSCHGPAVANTFANVTIASTPGGHIPIGPLDCNGAGCHTTNNVSPGGFNIGPASIISPTLSIAGHSTVAAAVPGCQTCHEAAGYLGMIGSASSASDSRPAKTFDALHPATGDCGGCHTTAPTFSLDVTTAGKPANHIPTSAACAQCHTTPQNYAAYSVVGTHQGVTSCLSCHGPAVASTFANVTIASLPGAHIPIGSLDCNGAGCHTTSNVQPGGFNIGTASISSPTLNVSGHTTVSAAVAGCQTCHESAPYMGMVPSSATVAGDSRPSSALDAMHPTTGDCGSCHLTTPTFASDVVAGNKPANHIPTTAPCTQCHTTAGNFAVYSVTGTHRGVTNCLSCHAPAVAATFANVTITTTSGNHIPIGSLDCNGSGCHTTANVNTGGFNIGTANINSPTLNVAGHTTVATAVAGCQTCHETAPYQGMIASSASTAGDSRPTTFDKSHPTTGDCSSCHTTTPTFAANVTSASKPANHIPTNAPCAQCHKTAGNYAAYVMGATGHTGITNGCALCHADGLSFANMAPPTLVEPPTGPTGHIPVGSLACEQCHSTANFTTFSGTVMQHAAVRGKPCVTCHEYGMTWKTNTGVRLWTRPSPNHANKQDCGGSGCHTSRDKRAIRPPALRTTASAASTSSAATAAVAKTTAGILAPPRNVSTVAARPLGAPGRWGAAMSAREPGAPANFALNTPVTHPSVVGASCASCHTAANGSGKPASHISTSASCQSCHTTLAWLPVTNVDHMQVKGTCASCHNGVTAAGKKSAHIASANNCEKCHTTNAWTPARFDHSSVIGGACTTCHNAVTAIGLPRNHVPTSQQCAACHGTLAWRPAKLDHSTIRSGCATCHNNSVAVGTPAAHMRTNRDCATCHSYPDWDAIAFRHVSAAYPGDHRATLTCSSCHTSDTDKIPYPSPANAGSCAGCHAKDFKPDAHPKTVKGQFYTATELANCSGACHVYADSSLSSVTKHVPASHHRVSDATFKH